MKQKITFPVLIASLFLIWFFSRSLLRSEFFLIHDYTHPARLAEMYRSLSAGQFPPHWSQNLGFGYGMPLFLFYGPLPYLIGCVFMLLGANPLQTTQLLFLLSNVLAFTGAYLLAKRWGRASGLISGALLLAAPYRAVDIYVRGALNEVIAIGILPWILHFALKIREDASWKPVALFALSVAALIMTHNLTALFSLPLIGIFIAIVFVSTGTHWKHWLRLILAGAWGVALSLFYSLPSFIEKSSTAIDSILSGYFDYHLHFLYIRQLLTPRWGYGGSEYGPNDGISFHLGWTALTLSLLAISFTIVAVVRHRKSFLDSFLDWTKIWKKHAPLRFWVVLSASVTLALSLFLTLNHSTFVWESVPLLNFVQFPWRILGSSIVFLSLLSGIAISHFKPAPLRWLATMFALLVILTQSPFHKPIEFLPANDGHFTTEPSEIRGNVSSVLPDYIPKGFNQKIDPVETEKRIQISTQTDVKWEMNDPHQLLAYSTQSTPATITWNIADFAGWKYYLNGKMVEPTKNKDGIMTYASDEPVESVGAQMELTPLRQYSLLVSLLAFIPLSFLIPLRKTYDQS